MTALALLLVAVLGWLVIGTLWRYGRARTPRPVSVWWPHGCPLAPVVRSVAPRMWPQTQEPRP